MQSNAAMKKTRVRTQIALALTLGMGTLPAAVLAAPITESQNYTADVTVTDDVDIANGTISVEGVDDDTTPRHENHTVTLKGSAIKITNSSGNILSALSRGDGTADWAGILTINPDRTGTVQLRGDILVDRRNEFDRSTSMRGGYVNLYLSGADSYFAGGITEVNTGYSDIPLHRRGGVRLELSDGATWYPKEVDSYTLFNPDAPPEFGETSTDGGATWTPNQPNKPIGFHISASGGVIDMAFAAPNVARTRAVGQRMLTFENTKNAFDGATFRISTHLTQDKADRVVLNGVTQPTPTTHNQYKLQVAFDPKMNDATDKTDYVIASTLMDGVEVLNSSNGAIRSRRRSTPRGKPLRQGSCKRTSK